MSFLLIVIVSVFLVLVAYIPCRYQSSIIDQLSEKAESNFWTALAQKKDIEGYLQQIKSLEEHCVAQKKVVDEYYSQTISLKQELGIAIYDNKALRSQVKEFGDELERLQDSLKYRSDNWTLVKTELEASRDTVRKLNRRAQRAESELIKSQKYHKNTKTYFKDRLEWSLDALKDARNLVTQLGNKIDWHLKTCNPFEKKEAELPPKGFQGDPNKENLSHIPPGSTFELDENGKVGMIWPPVRYEWEPNKGTWVKIATVRQEGDSVVMHKETK